MLLKEINLYYQHYDISYFSHSENAMQLGEKYLYYITYRTCIFIVNHVKHFTKTCLTNDYNQFKMLEIVR